MDKNIAHESLIQIKVGLNAEKVPVHMAWQAKEDLDGPDRWEECKAMLLSLFDKDHRDTLKMDLWTLDMQVMEMDRFLFQTLRGLADTYARATQNTELANEMQRFVQYFGEKTEVIPKS